MKVIVDRRTWLRGEPSSYLLRPEDSKMCCLGFACVHAGLSPDTIFRAEDPFVLWYRMHHDERETVMASPLAALLTERSQSFSEKMNSTAACNLMQVNDQVDFPAAIKLIDGGTVEINNESDREKLLTELGAKIGLEFEFIN